MKFFNRTAICIYFLVLCACSAPVNNKHKPDNSINAKLIIGLKGKSLTAVRELMQAQSEQFDAVFKLADLRLEITPAAANQNHTDEGVIHEPLYRSTPTSFMEEGLKELVSKFTFQQEIKPGGSELLTYLANDYTAPDFYSKDDNKAVLSTVVTIKKLFQHDHSAVDDHFGPLKVDNPVSITSRKPIDSLTAQFEFELVKKVDRLVLDKDNPKKEIEDGALELKQLGNSSAKLMIRGHTERVLAVAGIDTKGRLIDQNSSSSNSLPSPGKRKYFEELNKVLKSSIAAIEAGKYKSTDALLAAIKPKLPAEPEEEEISAQNQLISSYHFYQAIAKIVIYYASETKKVRHTVMLKNEPVIASGLSLAQGAKDGVHGIVNADGSWLIKPIYDNLIEINPYYYQSCQGSSKTCNFYRLDQNTKKLIPFKGSSLDGYAVGHHLGMENVVFYKIDPADLTVPAKGALNKNGQVILKPAYDLIENAGNYLLAARQIEKRQQAEFSLYTRTGRPVILRSPEAIGHDGQFIFVQLKTDAYDDTKKYKLLDQITGKSFLPAGSYSLETNWHEGMMLVGSGKNKFFINRTQTNKIDVSGYAVIKPFSHGYANVKSSKGFWGIINLKGDLVLGCTYDQISTVYNNLCLLSDKGPDQKERYGLYNVVTGDMVVPLMTHEDYNYGSVHGEGAAITYSIGSNRYDAFGHQLP